MMTKIKLWCCGALLMSALHAYAQQSDFFLYETKDGYTYVDKNFKPLMNKHFMWVGRFFEGLAAAAENGYVGYIDTKGNFVIPPEFEYALPFHNGIAKVWKDGKPYLIDKKGKILFEHNYVFIKYAINNSFEPIFIVTTRNGWKNGLVDKNGKVLVKPIYKSIEPFYENLAVAVDSDDNVGVINLQGKTIVPFGKYSQIGNFNSARTAVTSSDWDDYTVGFIDTRGNLVFKTETTADTYPSLPIFSDGLVELDTKNYYQLFDVNGKKIYKSDKHYVSVLKYGYAAVRDSSDTCNDIMDKQGKIIFHNADNVIKKNGKLYFIDNNFVDNGNYPIKNQAGAIVKKRNFYIDNSCIDDDYTHDYFVNNDLFFEAINNRLDSWSIVHSNSLSDDDNYFAFIDTAGFKDGLLYVVFRNRGIIIWGYLNKKGDIVYRNHNPHTYFSGDTSISLNINYLDQDDWENSIGYQETPLKQSFSSGKLSVILNQTTYKKQSDCGLYHSWQLTNETKDTLLAEVKIDEGIFLQAKDRNGVWRDIHEKLTSDIAMDGIFKLAPNNYWSGSVPDYSGGFKTKMRIMVKIPAVYDWKTNTTRQNDMELISNEIDCKINAAQFVRSGFTKTDVYPFEDYSFDRIITIP